MTPHASQNALQNANAQSASGAARTARAARETPALEFFAPCPQGLSGVAAQEIRDMHIKVRPVQTGVGFFGSIACAYRVCLFARTVSRVLLVLGRLDAHDADELYEGALQIPWEEHITPNATISVSATGTNDALRNTQFSALKLKDAICDRMRSKTGVRPDVSKRDADLNFSLVIRGNRATVSLNLSGAPLHMRNYRLHTYGVPAPLKETLAAGMLLLADWPAHAREGHAFLDPMCGSGTLAIEAAMIAADIAPGMFRTNWGFFAWKQHDASAWERLCAEAATRREAGLARLVGSAERAGHTECEGLAESAESAEHAEHTERAESAKPAALSGIVAQDIDPVAIEAARENAREAGLEAYITFACQDACSISAAPAQEGLIATNPPYGERLFAQAQLPALYAGFSSVLRKHFRAWSLAIVSSDESIDDFFGMHAQATVPVFNGRIEAFVRTYHNFGTGTGGASQFEAPVVTVGETTLYVFDANSQQFANRLKRRFTQARKWARRNNIHSYRVYDADLPDYNVAIDLYEAASSSETANETVSAGTWHAVIYEYAAPNSVDPARALHRVSDVLTIAPCVLGIESSHVFFKQRKRAKGQYQADDAHPNYVINTEEHGLLFEVNLSDYLDTGLFLDHRLVRELIQKRIEALYANAESGFDERHPVRFLNLFCYTGAATVHAAAGGAHKTTSVDLSQTYLNRAQHNMRLNGFGEATHRFERADCVQWIAEARRNKQRFDFIFVDPPAFSNSKKMGKRVFDIQRDHVELLIGVSRLLSARGEAIFSCNLRTFKPDYEALERFGVKLTDITAQTIDEDFARNQRIHHCFLVTPAGKLA